MSFKKKTQIYSEWNMHPFSIWSFFPLRTKFHCNRTSDPIGFYNSDSIYKKIVNYFDYRSSWGWLAQINIWLQTHRIFLVKNISRFA